MTADGVLYDIQTTQDIPFRNGVFAFSHVSACSESSVNVNFGESTMLWMVQYLNRCVKWGRLLANPECTTQTILTFRKSLLVCFVWTLCKLIKQ